MSYEFTKKAQTVGYFTYLAFFSMICSLLLMLVGAIGYRYNFLDIPTSLLTLTKYGVYGCIVGLSSSFIAFGNFVQRKSSIYEFLLLLCTGIICIIFISEFINTHIFASKQSINKSTYSLFMPPYKYLFKKADHKFLFII